MLSSSEVEREPKSGEDEKESPLLVLPLRIVFFEFDFEPAAPESVALCEALRESSASYGCCCSSLK